MKITKWLVIYTTVTTAAILIWMGLAWISPPPDKKEEIGMKKSRFYHTVVTRIIMPGHGRPKEHKRRLMNDLVVTISGDNKRRVTYEGKEQEKKEEG